MERESLRLLLAQGVSLDEIGRRFGKNGSTVGYWVKKHGLKAAHRERHAARGGLERTVLAALAAEGHSMRSMARELDVSLATVRHWMAKYELHSTAYVRHTSGVRNDRAGLPEVERRCSTHGLTAFGQYGPRGYSRCKRCRSGRCALCGYDRSPAALHFHHLDPGAKAFELSRNGVTRSIVRARAEAAKCVLLCANCHAEVEAGTATVESMIRA